MVRLSGLSGGMACFIRHNICKERLGFPTSAPNSPSANLWTCGMWIFHTARLFWRSEMTPQQIKANAPDGATHVDHGGIYWKVVSSYESYFTVDGINWIRFDLPSNININNGLIKPL